MCTSQYKLRFTFGCQNRASLADVGSSTGVAFGYVQYFYVTLCYIFNIQNELISKFLSLIFKFELAYKLSDTASTMCRVQPIILVLMTKGNRNSLDMQMLCRQGGDSPFA